MKKDNESGAAMNLDDEIEEFLGNRLLGTDLQLSASETIELIHELKSQQLKIETLEAKLKLAKEQLNFPGYSKSELLNEIPLGLISVSKDGFIREINQKAAKIFNQERSVLKDTLLVNYLSEESAGKFLDFLRSVFTVRGEESCGVTLGKGEDAKKYVQLTGLAADQAEVCKIYITDLPVRINQTDEREEVFRVMMNIRNRKDFRGWMSEALEALQKFSGCEAVAIRLRDGDDFPYFETRGFPLSFIRAESQICSYGIDGSPELNCICGSVLCGRTDMLKPFVTLRGSFWTNHVTRFLSSPSLPEYQAKLFSRCQNSGYESVALVPLKTKDKVLGLLQFNDPRPEHFSPALIEELEKMADYLAKALIFRKAEKALRKSARFQSDVLESIRVGVIATTKSGKIKFLNSAAAELTGWELNEARLKSVEEVFKILTKPKVADIGPADGMLTEGLVNRNVQTLLIRKDGKELPINGTRTVIKNKKGRKEGILLEFRDVSGQKQIEEDLIWAWEKAEENFRSKSAFLANMSHEIRTPMNGIIGFAELLKDPEITKEEQMEYVGIIEKSGERMLSIINDIINISKVESGQMKVNISETNANDQIGFIYNFFKREAEQKGIELRFKTPLPEKEAVIRTDREKVYAVLTNLVKNAIKFTAEGYIELGYEKRDNCLEFYVKDTGNGIPKEQQDLIFERFKQADVPVAGTYDSSGLGLSISKAYVEMLGGKIRVESEPGKGSVFYFTLPYGEGKEEITAVSEAKEEKTVKEEDTDRIKRLKILIVDDDDVSTLFLQKVTGRYGREILKVRTGLEAVELCRNNPDIDLILMDIEMPEMDGYTATEQIRRFDKNVIIIAETAFALYNDSGKAIEAGCNDYISKPINQVLLNEMINKYFPLADKAAEKGIG